MKVVFKILKILLYIWAGLAGILCLLAFSEAYPYMGFSSLPSIIGKWCLTVLLPGIILSLLEAHFVKTVREVTEEITRMSKPLSSRLLSRATSVKETSGDILERLHLLGCDTRHVDKIVVEPKNKLPKGTKELWIKRSIEIDERGVIHVKFFGSPQWWSYPLNFDVK